MLGSSWISTRLVRNCVVTVPVGLDLTAAALLCMYYIEFEQLPFFVSKSNEDL